uniref:Uncharacterized protein n=2 Tax=Lactuca sativa TaxID=4236 RepID=A0A9R1VAJ8_LACSA|nr:hypothetical protein LSAT_V11C500287870 [Lactuca sativa]KAJ0207298.1 hypothetical protein LSAT_V11C500287810 [Lactuca sativa]
MNSKISPFLALRHLTSPLPPSFFFLKSKPLTPNINLYAPTPLKRTLEIFFGLISANRTSRILKQSREITSDFHPLFSSTCLLSPKSTPLTGDGHSGRRVLLSSELIQIGSEERLLLITEVYFVSFHLLDLGGIYDINHLILGLWGFLD